MQSFGLGTTRRILCLGAHSDDIEIGAGATLLSALEARRDVEVHWVVFSACGDREVEARRSAERFLDNARASSIECHEFRDGYFPYDGGAIKDCFEALKSIGPDLILTHHRDDRHQDHRLVSELTWNTFRDHLILEYEIPKFDGGLATPNLFVHVEERVLEQKLDILMEVFSSQRSKRWFNRGSFEALARLRGVEANSATGLAEGFYAHKSRLDLAP